MSNIIKLTRDIKGEKKDWYGIPVIPSAKLEDLTIDMNGMYITEAAAGVMGREDDANSTTAQVSEILETLRLTRGFPRVHLVIIERAEIDKEKHALTVHITLYKEQMDNPGVYLGPENRPTVMGLYSQELKIISVPRVRRDANESVNVVLGK